MAKKRATTTVFCSVCKRGNKHEVRREVERIVFHEEIGEHYWDRYEILQCCGCENVSFKHSSGNSEDLDDDGQPILTNKRYPSPYIREPIADHYYLPPKVGRAYKECGRRGAWAFNLNLQLPSSAFEQIDGLWENLGFRGSCLHLCKLCLAFFHIGSGFGKHVERCEEILNDAQRSL